LKILDFHGLPLGSGIPGLGKHDFRDFLDCASGFFIEIPDFLGLPLGYGIPGLEKLDSRDFLDWASGFFIEMPDFPRFAFRIRDFLETPRFSRFASRIREFAIPGKIMDFSCLRLGPAVSGLQKPDSGRDPPNPNPAAWTTRGAVRAARKRLVFFKLIRLFVEQALPASLALGGAGACGWIDGVRGRGRKG